GRGDFGLLAAGWSSASGFYSGDYVQDSFTIRNADVQGFVAGVSVATIGANQTVENSYFRNYVDIGIGFRYNTGGADTLNTLPVSTVIRNVRFDPAGVQDRPQWGPQAFIAKAADVYPNLGNLIAPNPVGVSDF